ncbi:MAG: Lrp/AsnC family transcriptional regulator, partial [Lachnospiraceae bacterium]|nr:Lrp/AsnC family transcriptional regulator [Lachnospiraceae bacterium]
MKKDTLDHIDLQILNMLQEDARKPVKDIAEAIFLSSPTVSARIERMEKSGIIEGYHASINPFALGYHIKAFISLEIEPVRKKEFYPYIKKCNNVI